MRASSTTVQAVHAQSAAVANKLASFPALAIAACTALVFLAAAAICVFIIMRPLLKVITVAYRCAVYVIHGALGILSFLKLQVTASRSNFWSLGWIRFRVLWYDLIHP